MRKLSTKTWRQVIFLIKKNKFTSNSYTKELLGSNSVRTKIWLPIQLMLIGFALPGCNKASSEQFDVLKQAYERTKKLKSTIIALQSC